MESNEFKLRRFYYLAELSGEIAILIFGFLLFHFRQFFPWITYPYFNIWLFIVAVALHFTCFVLREVTHKRVFFIIARYIFFVFFCIFIWTTGGIDSPFVFLLIFPLLVSTADLDERSTKHIGYLIVAFLTSMLVYNLRTDTDPSFILLFLIKIILFALISVYLYNIVTETLRQKYEKEEANKKLIRAVELDRMKTVFVTIAQHQLRTPLSGVHWALENVLKEGGLPADAVPLLQESYGKVEDSIKIVGEMLKTAELNIEGLKSKRKPLDLAAMTETIISKLAYLIKKNVVELKFEKIGDCMFTGDADTLEPAITNVIDNAIRYSPKGTVIVTVAGDKSQVKIAVSDTGIGIDSVDQQNIFERFYRGKNAIAIDPNESGIGLYSTKNIIELHGGTISFASNIGKGTTFTLIFPK